MLKNYILVQQVDNGFMIEQSQFSMDNVRCKVPVDAEAAILTVSELLRDQELTAQNSKLERSLTGR